MLPNSCVLKRNKSNKKRRCFVKKCVKKWESLDDFEGKLYISLGWNLMECLKEAKRMIIDENNLQFGKEKRWQRFDHPTLRCVTHHSCVSWPLLKLTTTACNVANEFSPIVVNISSFGYEQNNHFPADMNMYKKRDLNQCFITINIRKFSSKVSK